MSCWWGITRTKHGNYLWTVAPWIIGGGRIMYRSFN